MGDVAMEELTQLIVDNQTLNVDTVSGATLSSMAFIGAVGDALEQAGEDAGDWKKRDKGQPRAGRASRVGRRGGHRRAAVPFRGGYHGRHEGKSVVCLRRWACSVATPRCPAARWLHPATGFRCRKASPTSPEALAEDMLVGATT